MAKEFVVSTDQAPRPLRGSELLLEAKPSPDGRRALLIITEHAVGAAQLELGRDETVALARTLMAIAQVLRD